MVELTSGFRLLGSPVGSASFAKHFFVKQIKIVSDNTQHLAANVPDLHTRLRLFSQCVIQKLPHLLGIDVMHHLPSSYDGHHWEEWQGPVVQGIGSAITDFLNTLLSFDSLPLYALQIAQLSLAKGGLNLLNASARAIPDFVLSMAKAMRNAGQGFKFGVDLEPTILHPSITDLFLPAQNPDSPVYLQRFQLALPHIARVACSDKCPPEDRVSHFLFKLSSHSARSRIKKQAGEGLHSTIYKDVQTKFPEHLFHLPGMLVPQTSYLLVVMSRSDPGNRLSNTTFLHTISRKLRLPIFRAEDCLQCWCGAHHDIYGDHAFCCVSNNKKAAHDIFKDGAAQALQKPLATLRLKNTFYRDSDSL